MIKKAKNPGGNAHRVITFLTRDELDFLDRLGKDALFSAGCKLSRNKIISAIVNVIRKLNIDGQGVSSRKELESKIVKAINNEGSKKEGERKGEENGTVL